jgi:hypothetical protein
VSAASGTRAVTPDKTTDFVLTATGPDGKVLRSDPVAVNVASGGAAALQLPAATPQPATANSFFGQLLSPVPLITLLSVIVLIVLGILLFRVYKKRWAGTVELPLLLPGPEKPREVDADKTPPNLEQSGSVRARLELPNGLEITLSGNSRAIGRGELARALGLDELCLVSRKQFELTYEDSRYFIEDADGVNSSRLNGDDIKDKGKSALHDGDVIDVAGAIKLTFSVID